MDPNKTALALAELGCKEARLMRNLMKLQKRRCRLLTDAAPHAGLEPDVAAQSVAPKDQ
jgi:hypothetical protein